MNLNLGKELEAYINHTVSTDITYNSASEWVREAIREKINSDLQYNEKLEALKADINIGLDQIKAGQVVEINFDELIKESD